MVTFFLPLVTEDGDDDGSFSCSYPIGCYRTMRPRQRLHWQSKKKLIDAGNETIKCECGHAIMNIVVKGNRSESVERGPWVAARIAHLKTPIDARQSSNYVQSRL